MQGLLPLIFQGPCYFLKNRIWIHNLIILKSYLLFHLSDLYEVLDFCEGLLEMLCKLEGWMRIKYFKLATIASNSLIFMGKMSSRISMGVSSNIYKLKAG